MRDTGGTGNCFFIQVLLTGAENQLDLSQEVSPISFVGKRS